MQSKIKTLFSRSYKLEARSSCRRGITLIDTLVGSALMLIVFVGIAGVFKLSIDVVTNNKARAGAIALADDRIEYMHSLAYSSIGTAGGIPSGTILQSETVVSNGVSYTRRTTVEYADDPGDGIGASDTNGITLDYKTARVDLAWESRTGTRHITLVTRITPPSGMETACPPTAECGTLTATVLNAELQPVSNAQVHVVNTITSPGIDLTTFTNTSGIVSLVGAPASTGYQITVTKTGYSTDQTYDATAQNTNPTPGPFTVSNNQTTSPTFRLDLLSNMSVSTFSLSTNTWSDSFADESKIGPSTNIEISGNRARFAGIQPWTAPADLRSQTITPVALSRWGVFSWNDTQPSETTITYRVYYPDGSTPTLVPDAILSGNSSGFTAGTSVDLSAIPAGTYPSLILDAYLVALNPSAPSPSVEDWDLTYQSGQGIAIPFTMRGAKTIGSGPNGTIYKYDQTLSTDSSGILSIPNLEWDSYTMTVAPATGYDLASSCLPQPIVLAPNTSLSAQLYFSLHTTDSLLVDVKNSTGNVLSGATVQLTKGGSYDRTIIADACGQAFFDSLTNGNYSISVSAVGFQTYDVSGINVTGSSRLSVTLN
ncbi:MAG: carboxypeptidase regulatory-like domain-containing protein [Candidatus Kaiserbacteria bacterium]|nr:carboxypeptidase regulatory-like domain-containing protein [Candidatus Kaiserbacteria bacterium]